VPHIDIRRASNGLRCTTDGRPVHRIQAPEVEYAQQWFAAAFHLKWLLKEDPADADVRLRLQSAQAHLKPAQP
jgi:hypothetical protein